MPDPYPANEPLRRVALNLLRRGLVTPTELAPLVKLTPQAVHKWAIQAKIDLAKARKHYVRQCWQSANLGQLLDDSFGDS
jgi:hypothetical protein